MTQQHYEVRTPGHCWGIMAQSSQAARLQAQELMVGLPGFNPHTTPMLVQLKPDWN